MVSRILSIAVIATVAHGPSTQAFTTPSTYSSSLTFSPRITRRLLHVSPTTTMTTTFYTSLTTTNIISKLSMTASLFADATPPKVVVDDDATTTSTAQEEMVQTDVNGQTFIPGCTVAVITDMINAHSVPKTSYGTFHSTTGEFIPRDDNDNTATDVKNTRKTACLVLPIGLRGTVERVYDANTWDRARPIVVKFSMGYDRTEEDGGLRYNIPKEFRMHFDATELEIVL